MGLFNNFNRKILRVNFNFDKLVVNFEIRNPRMGIIKMNKMLWIRRILSHPQMKRDHCSVLQVI